MAIDCYTNMINPIGLSLLHLDEKRIQNAMNEEIKPIYSSASGEYRVILTGDEWILRSEAEGLLQLIFSC